jgi:hypothetical protein
MREHVFEARDVLVQHVLAGIPVLSPGTEGAADA